LRGAELDAAGEWRQELIIEIVFVGERVLLVDVRAERHRSRPRWRLCTLDVSREVAFDLSNRDWTPLTEADVQELEHDGVELSGAVPQEGSTP